jgi:hypothetical protein
MIADCLAAWRVINEQGRAPVDAPTRQVAASLEQLDAGLAGRLARAMEFVRPGFDEPCPVTVRPWSVTPDEDDDERAPSTRWMDRMRAAVKKFLAWQQALRPIHFSTNKKPRRVNSDVGVSCLQ